jgi:hypothetical protein
MYLRRTTRKRKDGSEQRGRVSAVGPQRVGREGGAQHRAVLHSFGREDLIDRAAIERLKGKYR